MTTTSTWDDRGGFALPVAVFALVMVGVLVTSGFFLAQQETRVGVASSNANQAVYLAEDGVSTTLLDWADQSFTDLAVGEVDSLSGTGHGGEWVVEVLRTSGQTYFLTSYGEVTEGGNRAGANRRLGTLVRILMPDLDPPAAIATVDSISVGGSSQIQGHDDVPDAWSGGLCDDPPTDKPGILIDDSTAVERNGGAHEIDGQPAVEEDPDLTADDLLDFGGVTWDELASMADHVFPSTTTVNNTAPSLDVDGNCDRSDRNNWGDPENPSAECGNFFPIIYAGQDLKLNSSSSGQGIMLVEGNVEFKGGFEFYGVVIAKGSFVTAGTGGHVNGGVIATNASIHEDDDGDDESEVTGNAVVTNATCAAQRAIENNSSLTRPRPLAQRSWVDLTALSY